MNKRAVWIPLLLLTLLIGCKNSPQNDVATRQQPMTIIVQKDEGHMPPECTLEFAATEMAKFFDAYNKGDFAKAATYFDEDLFAFSVRSLDESVVSLYPKDAEEMLSALEQLYELGEKIYLKELIIRPYWPFTDDESPSPYGSSGRAQFNYALTLERSNRNVLEKEKGFHSRGIISCTPNGVRFVIGSTGALIPDGNRYVLPSCPEPKEEAEAVYVCG